MKTLVVSHCNTKGYYDYLKAMFPNWDVRSAVHVQAAQWLEEGHAGFAEFLPQVDLFVGLPDSHVKLCAAGLNPRAHSVLLPGFIYRATRPDCFWFNGVPSSTESGVIHSRIATAAYALGKSVEDTLPLFCAGHYERLGYFDQYGPQRNQLLKIFEVEGVDLAADLDKWEASGDFMHTPNHPAAGVLFDVIHRALQQNGIDVPHAPAVVQRIRTGIGDYLGEGILWPVYPELANRFGLHNTVPTWRTSLSHHGGEIFDLVQMLHRSFAIFDAQPNLHDRAQNMLGGPDLLAELGGA
jgi:hypothetical protein